MSLKKIALIIPFAIFVVVSIFMACSGDEELPVVYPPTDQLQVYYISSDDASNIVIDGDMDEGIWQAATQSQLTAYDTSHYNPKAQIFLVKMTALCDSTYVYISATWQDDTKLDSNYLRWRWIWRKNSTSFWNRDLTKEDNFAIFFEMNSQTSLGINEIGPNCLSMCHEPLNMVNDSGAPVDGWYWRSTVLQPLSSALDLYIVDSLDTDSLYYGLDGEDGPGYLYNRDEKATLKPLYWTADPEIYDTIVVDTIYNDDEEIDSIITDTIYIWNHGDFIFAPDAVKIDTADADLDSPKVVDTVFVPSYVIYENASGSRWDVEAKGNYSGGRWTVEFKRKMNTGNTDDVVFNVGDEIGIVIAVGDDFKNPHYGFEPILLKF